MEINGLINEYNKQIASLQEQLQSAFKTEINKFFEQNPEVRTITWAQYTPWWNDGETCEFDVNEPVFTNAVNIENSINLYGDIEDEEEAGLEEGETLWISNGWGDERETYQRIVPKETRDNISELSKVIQSNAMEDVLLAMFGDHSQIVINKNGITVEEYEHD